MGCKCDLLSSLYSVCCSLLSELVCLHPCTTVWREVLYRVLCNMFLFLFFSFRKKKQMLFIGLKKGYDNNGASDQFIWFLHWTQYRYVRNQDQRVPRQDLNSSMENRTKFVNFTDFSTGTSNPLAPSFSALPPFSAYFHLVNKSESCTVSSPPLHRIRSHRSRLPAAVW